MRFLAAACALIAFALPAVAGGARTALTVAPARALVDQPVDVRVTELRPHGRVELVATARDADGVGWRSQVGLTANGHGVADTRRSMRLFWSMRPLKPNVAFALSTGAMRVLVRAQMSGHTVAAASFVRRLIDPRVAVRELTVAHDGIAGTYLAPPVGARPAPAVIILGGSGGGHGRGGGVGGTLASRGYGVLSLGYFAEPGLPQQLRRVPLEYFRTALQWLARQPGVDPHRLVIMGISRGGEAALLVGATYPDLVRGVLSCTGGANVIGSVPAGDYAWTLGGKPVPFGPIPVWKIAGPVLAFGGGLDNVGPSAQSVEQIVSEAREHGRKDIVGRIFWKAGHGVGCQMPNVPFVGAMDYAIAPGVTEPRGGTAAANESAAEQAWPLVLHFLATIPR